MILVTGANGFVGKSLCETLGNRGLSVRGAVRAIDPGGPIDETVVAVGDIDQGTSWQDALAGVQVVVHLAARVHLLGDNDQALDAYRRVNVAGTLNLARQAAAAGVQRVVFLSSIKVNGESTAEIPFRHSDTPVPVDPYGISKLEAEQGLQELMRTTGIEVVIIRPPLVYGAQAGGNFDRLRRLAVQGFPLPLGSVNNKRSLIGVENLCDCIRVCLEHPAAVGEPLLVSDNQDISTPDLVRLLAFSAGRSIRLPPVPVGLLLLFASFCGKGAEIRRLTENLQVDCSQTLRQLNWQPPFSLEQGIKRSIV